jgi:hypothetical protein
VKKYLIATAAALAIGVGVGNGQPPSNPSVVPNLSVTPVQGGTVYTPSMGVNVPLGGGSSLQGTLSVPVIVPNSGPTQVAPPTASVQVVIPIK